MAYVPTWKERLEEAKQYIGPAIASVIVVAMLGWLVWHFRAKAAADRVVVGANADAGARAAAIAKLEAEVDRLERDYRRALEVGATSASARSLLDRAITKQTERMRLEAVVSPEQTDRLQRLEAARGSDRSRAALTRSQVLENEATALRQEGRSVEAMEKLREALRLQAEANTHAGPGEIKDVARESRLATEIALAEAEPMRRQVSTAITLARSAVAQEKWDNALNAFNDARAAMVDLTQRYPTTRFPDLPTVEKIDGEIQSLRASGLATVAMARERDGDVAARAGRALEAAAFYEAAATARREINEKFARSRFASEQKVDELEVQRQTVLSNIALGRAAALEAEADAALRRRQNLVAAEKIAAAGKLVEKVVADFPRSRSLNSTLQRKAAFLALRTADFDAIQDQVLTRLAAVPGVAGVQMLKTEVSQEFYQQIMNANPSRNLGRTLPVDSVSWLDAVEFCERLSWLLGRKVRLPTEGEFAAALAGITRETVAGAWSNQTGGGRSHEVGKSAVSPAGFFDLVGNVAEWLQPPSAQSETAPVAGGSYLDSLDALFSAKSVAEEKRTRARHVGFRVVVEAANE